MNTIGKSERTTQNRIIQFFQQELGYEYLGDWQEAERTLPIEEEMLYFALRHKQGYSEELSRKAIDKLIKTASNLSEGLYEANKQVYKLLRYGMCQ